MDDPFTPSRSLKRTPPLSRPLVSAMEITEEMDEKVNPFAAAKSLKRTPYVSKPPVAVKLEFEGEKELEGSLTQRDARKHTPPLPDSAARSNLKGTERIEDLVNTKRDTSVKMKARKRGVASVPKSKRFNTPPGAKGTEIVTQESATTTGEVPKGSVDEEVFDAGKRGVQASCFTPKKTLRRSLRSCPEPSQVCYVLVFVYSFCSVTN